MQPNTDNTSSAPTPPLLDQSMAAFYRNLPELLKKHYGMWVAYHGDELIGVDRSQTTLHIKCVRRGLNEDDFVVLFADRQALHDNDEINTWIDGD